MPTMKLSFPAGRYHATPWGHHVNEGQIEWPPSPWRLLRAFIATGYSKLYWQEVPQEGRRLIDSLSEVLPEYLLPTVSSAHSRHYMPIGKIEKGQEKTTLVFDTWANIGDGEIVVRWDCKLDAKCKTLFRQLVEHLGYLGRSESWVLGSVEDDNQELSTLASALQQHSFPHNNGSYPGPEWEQVQIVAPTSSKSYAEWRTERIEPLLAGHPLPEGKKKPTKSLLKKRAAATSPYPVDLIDCLQKDTSWWKRQHKWSQPPGSQRVLYWRRTNSLVVSQPSRSRQPEPARVSAMLLAISTPTRNGSALPSVIRTLPQAELFHRAIVGRVGRGKQVDCPELTGKDEVGRALKGNHEHAHVLPLDLDDDSHLDHILIWARMGLGGKAQRAIRSLKRTWTKGGVGELQVSVVGRGELDDLRQLPESLSDGVYRLLGPPSGGTQWISQTPYVLPRFQKKNGRHSLAGQLREELQSRYGATLVSFKLLGPNHLDNENELLGDKRATRVRQHRHFIRVRKHGGRVPPADAGFTVMFAVDQPIQGPVCLGYGSHFGLGMFMSVLGATK